MTPATVSEYEKIKQNLEHFRHEVGKLHSRVATLEAKNADLLEALRQCISPIGGYAIKDSAQALEVVSDFLTQICRTTDIAKAAISKATGAA